MWVKQEGHFRRVCYLWRSILPEGVMRMSDYQLISIVFTVIGLLFVAYQLGTKQ